MDEHELRAKLTPQIGSTAFELPAPKLSPDERKQRRLAFRNERLLYRRKCDFTGKEIISMYSPDKPFKVYSNEAWWSDAWDPFSYGRDFDFSRTFFEQFWELRLEVPRLSLIKDIDAEANRCLYVNFAGNNKNCYMTFDSDFNEDSLYSNVLKHSRCCIDCSYVQMSELCYECIDCTRCYNLRFSRDCTGCSDSAFLDQCIGCRNCFFCSNLAHREYCFENRQYSKDDYLHLVSSARLESRERTSALAGNFTAFQRNHPKKYCHILKCEDCIGDYLHNSRRCYHSFNIGNCEELYYCDSLYAAKTCMDVSSFGENIERVYESGTIGLNSYNIYFSFACVSSDSDIYYCDGCVMSKNCFGCCSLRRGEYCILNKCYTREEYEKLAGRIIAHMRETGEWGEHFPLRLSAFGYNETIAQEHFPLSRKEAAALGANWSDHTVPAPAVRALSAGEVPDVCPSDDAIAEAGIVCPETGKIFRLTTAELRFYRKNGIPIPLLHPDKRHINRIMQRNPQTLWERQCGICGQTLYSSYAPGRPEKIYCEKDFAQSLS